MTCGGPGFDRRNEYRSPAAASRGGRPQPERDGSAASATIGGFICCARGEAVSLRDVTIDWPTYNRQGGGTATARSRRSTRRTRPGWRRNGCSRCPIRRACRGHRWCRRRDVRHQRQRVLRAGRRHGRQIWHYQRPRTKGVIGMTAGGVNRASRSTAIACSWPPTMRI